MIILARLSGLPECGRFSCRWVGRPRWGCKGDHKGRPYVASPSQSGGEGQCCRIIAASVLGLRERKIVGGSVNKIPSVADVARPSALRTAVVRRAVRHRSIVPRAVVVASSARRDGKTSAG